MHFADSAPFRRSPNTLDLVFEGHNSFILDPLYPSDISLIFDASPETSPTYDILRRSSLPPVISLLVTVARLTNFQPSNSILNIFERVQALLTAGSDHFDSLFSDLESRPGGDEALGREDDFLAYFFPAELILFRLAWNCVVLLSKDEGRGQASERKAALRTAEETVHHTLARCSSHVQILMVRPLSPYIKQSLLLT